MRPLLAGIVATLMVAGLAALKPDVLTSDEKAAAAAIQEHRIRADIRFLASDLLEGRGPATRGDRLTQAFVASRFEAIGLEPGAPNGTWFQPFDLIAVETQCPETLRVTREGDRVDLRVREDFVASSGVQSETAAIDDAEIVFVGYGIQAPEYGWDDFEGADLSGKVLLVMNNDPEDDPALFEGRRRLYYGRWDYKYAMAARQGAVGAIIIHTTPSAGYGWSVVQNSWGGKQYALPAQGGPALQVAGWATEEASRRIARLAGYSLDALRSAAEQRRFRPVPLGVRMSLSLKNRIERRQSANVIGRHPGDDPAVAGEAVLYTAHHDHLGMKPGEGNGPPTIYNGALDNASGVATMLAIAEAFAALPQGPRRSVVFATVGAEEQGLLGSEYLARNPPVPVGRLAADINIDGMNIWGRTHDVAVVGLGKSTLDDWIRAIAEAQGRIVVPEAFPDKGAYYRSDHFSLARVGVPSVYLDVGTDVVGKPAGWGRRQQEAWEKAHYHQPSDDLSPDWDLAGAVEDAQLLFSLGVKVADAPTLPEWRPGDEFEAAREKALAALED
ncbi:MAG: M28 family peptidase [Acidobacteriota bacterium]|jgi:Zn-dependent M28 family amino/carboxypeptidase